VFYHVISRDVKEINFQIELRDELLETALVWVKKNCGRSTFQFYKKYPKNCLMKSQTGKSFPQELNKILGKLFEKIEKSKYRLKTFLWAKSQIFLFSTNTKQSHIKSQ